jgi:hypothetical protein
MSMASFGISAIFSFQLACSIWLFVSVCNDKGWKLGLVTFVLAILLPLIVCATMSIPIALAALVMSCLLSLVARWFYKQDQNGYSTSMFYKFF